MKLLLFIAIFQAQAILASNIYTKKLRTVDRHYVYSTLRKIFGPESKDTLKKYILTRPEVFAGGCLPYKVSRIKKNNKIEIENEEDSCINHASEIGDPSFKPITTIRQSFTDTACTEIVNSPIHLNFLLDGQKLSIKSDRNYKNVLSVSSLFFFKNKVAKRYTKVLSSKKDLSWREIILTICKSPEWQIL